MPIKKRIKRIRKKNPSNLSKGKLLQAHIGIIIIFVFMIFKSICIRIRRGRTSTSMSRLFRLYLRRIKKC